MHWKNPTLMAGCFFGGIGIAFAHHFFYDWLSGRPAEHQDWMIRVGTLLAALSKISLSAAISIACTQLIWKTLQKRYFTLEGVSGLFAVTSNPLNLFSWELVSNATVAILCGTVLLFTPLITILAPGSLSVTWAASHEFKDIQVSTLNFSIDPLAEMHEPSFGATTKLYDWEFWSVNPGRAEGSATYSRSSSVTGAVVYQTTYGGEILQGELPCGANCSFSQTFYGPAYQCKAVDSFDPATPWCKALEAREQPCSEHVLKPYSARNSSQDFCDKYLINDCSSFSTADEWMDGVIWLQYTFLPLDHRDSVTDYSWRTPPPGTRNYTFRCEQWTTKFDITRTYTESRQHIDANYTYMRQVPYFPVTVNWKGSFTWDKYFGENHNMSWQDYASFAVHEQLYSILKGEIASNDWNSPLNGAQLEGSRLVEDDVWPLRDGIHKPLENLNELVEELSRNVTLSLFSVQNLIYSRDKVDTFAEINNFSLVFHYDMRALIITYGVAVFCTLIIVIIGTLSFLATGRSMDADFLTTMVTTRGEMLDDLARGSESGAQPFSKTLLETKVQFDPSGRATGRATGRSYGNVDRRDPYRMDQLEGLHRKPVRSSVYEPSANRPGFKVAREM